MSTSANKVNRLAAAKSPYLRQHMNNPVDWYEWNAEAFEKARNENLPIFLSVGYSACHWCHVMAYTSLLAAHESFEDPTIAASMNKRFINIKVDREERPDVDKVYMTFVQAITRRGGWPMSVFLTPHRQPFFGGTYWPPATFNTILDRVSTLWTSDPEKCEANGANAVQMLQNVANAGTSAGEGSAVPADLSLAPQKVYQIYCHTYDPKWGGFGSKPKFPTPSKSIDFLLHWDRLQAESSSGNALQMATLTLRKIAEGGIHDHVGHGFARYSVDDEWHVPHFEKMLYDQAQLLVSFTHAFLLTQDPLFREMAKDVVQYVTSDLSNPSGGFYSAEDADSLPDGASTHAIEGAFYTWTKEELIHLLKDDEPLFSYHFGVDAAGNVKAEFDIQGELNILIQRYTISETAKRYSKLESEVQRILDESKNVLKAYRNEHRPRPHLDDKILTAWNGLMISGLAHASTIFSDEDAALALKAAAAAVAFIKKNLYDNNSKRLLRSYRDGPSAIEGFAEDYSYLIRALLDLYEVTFQHNYLQWALELQQKQDEIFWDAENGGYFLSAADDPLLVIRTKEDEDGAIPNSNSIALLNLLTLASIVENPEYTKHCDAIIESVRTVLTSFPHALGTLSRGLMMRKRGMTQVIVVGSLSDPRTKKLLGVIREFSIPNRVLMHVDPHAADQPLEEHNAAIAAILEDTKVKERSPHVHVCKNFTCNLPVSNPDELRKLLHEA